MPGSIRQSKVAQLKQVFLHLHSNLCFSAFLLALVATLVLPIFSPTTASARSQIRRDRRPTRELSVRVRTQTTSSPATSAQDDTDASAQQKKSGDANAPRSRRND